jgi:hypothetical protein
VIFFACIRKPLAYLGGMETNFIEKTARVFGISFEQAKQMIAKANERNANTHANGKSLARAVNEGLVLVGGVADWKNI